MTPGPQPSTAEQHRSPSTPPTFYVFPMDTTYPTAEIPLPPASGHLLFAVTVKPSWANFLVVIRASLPPGVTSALGWDLDGCAIHSTS
jgi:hypothetical protein